MALSSLEAASLWEYVERCGRADWPLQAWEATAFVALAEKCASEPRSRGEFDFGAEALLGVAKISLRLANDERL